MGSRPNVLLQIRFRDDDERWYFTALAEHHDIEVGAFPDDEEDGRPEYSLKVGEHEFSFAYYDGSQDPEFGIAEDEHGPQTIGYDYLTGDWTEVVKSPEVLARIEAARAWAQGVVDAIGGEFDIAIGANYY